MAEGYPDPSKSSSSCPPVSIKLGKEHMKDDDQSSFQVTVSQEPACGLAKKVGGEVGDDTRKGVKVFRAPIRPHDSSLHEAINVFKKDLGFQDQEMAKNRADHCVGFLHAINPKKEDQEKVRKKTIRKLVEIEERKKQIGSLEDVNSSTLLEATNRNLMPLWPLSKADKIREYLRTMKFFHKEEGCKFKAAFDTLLTRAYNIMRDPKQIQHRTIWLSNADFVERVGKLKGGVEFLEVWGFEKRWSVYGGELLYLPREKVDFSVLHSAIQELNYALNNPFFGTI